MTLHPYRSKIEHADYFQRNHNNSLIAFQEFKTTIKSLHTVIEIWIDYRRLQPFLDYKAIEIQ